MLGGLGKVASGLQAEREPIVGAREAPIELQSPAIKTDRFLRLARLGEGDGHALENARIVGVVTEGKPIGRQRGLEVALTLERHCLIEVVQTLGPESLRLPAAEQPPPEAHRVRRILEESGEEKGVGPASLR